MIANIATQRTALLQGIVTETEGEHREGDREGHTVRCTS